MGTARAFDEILKQELNIHAAWLPVTNTFKLGDYGLISDGVLVKAGNIEQDFGIPFVKGPGPPSRINFTSAGTRSTRVSASGTLLNVLPDDTTDAKLTIEFANQDSFLVKAELSVIEMQNLYEVAKALGQRRDWRREFRVVSAVYKGKQCGIVSAKSSKSKIELAGKANALRQFDLGAIAADISVVA
jgi:hypothetical protein